MADPYDVSIQAVSKHIAVLERAGLVSKTKDAQRRPVHLEAEVFDLMTKWIERYRRRAEQRYRRLDRVLAATPDQDPDVHRRPSSNRHHENPNDQNPNDQNSNGPIPDDPTPNTATP